MSIISKLKGQHKDSSEEQAENHEHSAKIVIEFNNSAQGVVMTEGCQAALIGCMVTLLRACDKQPELGEAMEEAIEFLKEHGAK
jgi:hypothetical protein